MCNFTNRLPTNGRRPSVLLPLLTAITTRWMRRFLYQSMTLCAADICSHSVSFLFYHTFLWLQQNLSDFASSALLAWVFSRVIWTCRFGVLPFFAIRICYLDPIVCVFVRSFVCASACHSIWHTLNVKLSSVGHRFHQRLIIINTVFTHQKQKQKKNTNHNEWITQKSGR